jgi:hypothetical protein
VISCDFYVIGRDFHPLPPRRFRRASRIYSASPTQSRNAVSATATRWRSIRTIPSCWYRRRANVTGPNSKRVREYLARKDNENPRYDDRFIGIAGKSGLGTGADAGQPAGCTSVGRGRDPGPVAAPTAQSAAAPQHDRNGIAGSLCDEGCGRCSVRAGSNRNDPGEPALRRGR